jgi:hypothetical protein
MGVDKHYGDGWTFFISGGDAGFRSDPAWTDEALRQWLAGFAAALADYGFGGKGHASIEESLTAHGVTGTLLARLLVAAESVCNDMTRFGGQYLAVRAMMATNGK